MAHILRRKIMTKIKNKQMNKPKPSFTISVIDLGYGEAFKCEYTCQKGECYYTVTDKTLRECLTHNKHLNASGTKCHMKISPNELYDCYQVHCDVLHCLVTELNLISLSMLISIYLSPIKYIPSDNRFI